MKGLIFSEPMVKAWLEGRKTLTRRLVKLPPDFVPEYACSAETENPSVWFDFVDVNGLERRIKAPYIPGETVYIKETWKPDDHFKGGGIPRLGIIFGTGCQWKVRNPDQSGPWKSPRFMLEWASRGHALIKSVRPERVQEITENDCYEEGIMRPESPYVGSAKVAYDNARSAFRSLWESLRPGSWERNDFVWRIELKKREGK